MSAEIWREALCRTYLSELDEVTIQPTDVSPREMWWFQIKGVTNFSKEMADGQYVKIFQELLSGCMIPFCDVGFLVVGDSENGIRFFVGVTDDEELYAAVRNNYQANIPGVDITEKVSYEELKVGKKHGGVVVGIPCQEKEERRDICSDRMPIDKICRGMLGREFAFMIIAERQPELIGSMAIARVDKLIMQNSSLLTATRTNETGLQITYANVAAQQYQKSLEQLQELLHQGMQIGLWNVCAYYSAQTQGDALTLKNSIITNFSGSGNSRYEQLRCIEVSGELSWLLSRRPPLIVRSDERKSDNPLNSGYADGFGEEYYQFLLQTRMTGKDLANFFTLPKKEMLGYYVDEYVEFDSMVREKLVGRRIQIGNITSPGRNAYSAVRNPYEVSLEDLSRHALIIGITGGGKTNTMKSLLSEIWGRNGVPFLVIESAKREYIELMQVENVGHSPYTFQNLSVFTLGNESENGVKYRLNPFEVMPGIALQTHIDYLLSTFNAAFEMYAPMPYILERAVYEVYEDRGWDLFTGANKRGLREYPTLSQLYYKIDVVTNRLGYDEEVQSNVKAALKARINSLRIGGKGAMLDVVRSIPLEQLLSTPCVFELEDIGDDDIKAFIIGILLVQLYEYRKSCGSSDKLKGVLVFEEAHRLLKSVSAGEGNNSRAKSVEFFCNMLAEIRSFGQGIIIADQIPTKLAADTIKNTNLKIVHRTVMEDDRQCIGAAMHMTEEQMDYLSSLKRGCAAVFAEGDSRPKLVMMPLVRKQDNRSREELISAVKQTVGQRFESYYHKGDSRNVACLYCEERKCPAREWLYKVQNFGIARYEKDIQLGHEPLQCMKIVQKEFENRYKLEPQERGSAFCTMGYLLRDLKLPEEKQAERLVEYMRYLYPVERR